jgi:hypothetical protein
MNEFPNNYDKVRPIMEVIKIYLAIITILNIYYYKLDFVNFLTLVAMYFAFLIGSKFIWILIYGPGFRYYYQINLGLEYTIFATFAIIYILVVYGFIFYNINYLYDFFNEV